VRGELRRRSAAGWVAVVVVSLAYLLSPATAVAGPGPKGGERPGAGKAAGIARHLRKDLNGILATARAQLIQLARLPSVQATDAGACKADMAARAADPRYTALGAAGLNAEVYCLSIPFTPPLSIADRAYFLRAIGTGDLGVGDFQFGRVTGQGAIGLGFPVSVGAAINGIVLATLSTVWLDQRLESERRDARDLLMIDDHGTVTAHAGVTPTQVGTNLGAVRLVKRMLRHERGAGIFRFGGRRARVAFDPVPLSEGGMHVAALIRP
jgi:hypothetical protein